MSEWHSTPVLAPMVQVRIAAMNAAVTERDSIVRHGPISPDQASDWTLERARTWEQWLWTESPISRAARGAKP